VHDVKVHEYFDRKVRSNKTKENEKILIFSIICEIAKANGWQYTKRILPEFVIPGCNIILDNVLRMYKRYSGSIVDYEDASEILGCWDNRTVKKHLLEIHRIIDKANEELAQTLSSVPQLVPLPEIKPDIKNFEILEVQIDFLNQASEKLRGKIFAPIISIAIIHKTYFEERLQNPIKPMDSVIFPIYFNDTS
jgi:hypothetical protein